jgi:flavin-dependent dehydrogenase
MGNSKVMIIGGGLAGLTAAIHLSKIGLEVVVIEKNEYPKHKVCGEYISNEVLPYLDWLGVNVSQLKPTAISKIIFSTANGKIINGNLPLGGFGISRYIFDEHLYRRAVENGCQFVQETVENIEFDADEFTITASNNVVLKSNIVIGAYGKRSNIDQKLHREFINKKSPWLAVKSHYAGEFPDDVVGLYNFKGGYCGVSKVENDNINICYLADYKTFKNYKNIEEYQNEVVTRNPHLKAIFENAKSLFDKPLTISQISFEKKNAVENHMLMAGDSVGMIHPFCGNGMAMAIHGAKIVAELVGKYHTGEIKSRSELEEKYKKAWDLHFQKRLSTGRFLARILRKSKLSESLMRILMMFPSLLPKIIAKTHGQPIILNS